MAFSLSSTELNYLVFRYLHESGFTHSSFAFGNEAGINKISVDGDLVVPGALVTFVQKGLQYLEMEANLSNSDTDLDEDFSFIHAMDLITKDTTQLRQLIKEKRKALQKDKEIEKEREGRGGWVRENIRREKNKGPQPMDISTNSTSRASDIPYADVTILEGHSAEVCACSWNPTSSLLASGSGDSTARIWSILDGSNRSGMRTSLRNVSVLEHGKSRTSEKSIDVTTLDWNVVGTLLATGSYDGRTRIWNSNGELRSTLIKHQGPVFSLKWNKKGDYLLTGSGDRTAIVWDVKSAECQQQFAFHGGTILDVDWRNAVTFATSSTDTMIHVFKIGEPKPIKKFSGHQGEVNCVKWNPSGSMLASCSDDCTVKIWSMKHATSVHDLREHSKEIYTIRWSPTGPGSNNPNLQSLLARGLVWDISSASFDSTVKLWDAEAGKLLCSLDGHREHVYSIAFSPDGQYLASGSMDRSLNIWSLGDQKVIKTYTGNGGIFEVCWNKDGNKIAACSTDKTVCVLDFRM